MTPSGLDATAPKYHMGRAPWPITKARFFEIARGAPRYQCRKSRMFLGNRQKISDAE